MFPVLKKKTCNFKKLKTVVTEKWWAVVCFHVNVQAIWIVIIVPLSNLLLTTFLACFIAGICYLAKGLEACMCMLSCKC